MKQVTQIFVYPGVIHRGETGNLGLSFPDLLGCITVGDSEAELAVMAAEALELHLEGMLEDGLPLPNPTPLGDIVTEDDSSEYGRILVVARVNEGIDQAVA